MKDGATPLFLAAENGKAKCMELLLAAGAVVDLPEKIDGFTPLRISAMSGHYCSVDLLQRWRARQ